MGVLSARTTILSVVLLLLIGGDSGEGSQADRWWSRTAPRSFQRAATNPVPSQKEPSCKQLLLMWRLSRIGHESARYSFMRNREPTIVGLVGKNWLRDPEAEVTRLTEQPSYGTVVYNPGERRKPAFGRNSFRNMIEKLSPAEVAKNRVRESANGDEERRKHDSLVFGTVRLEPKSMPKDRYMSIQQLRNHRMSPFIEK